MSDLRVVFVGCNPSLKNADPDVPFMGTRSGKVLDKWIEILGLKQEQCGFINLIKYATKDQGKLKKSDVNLQQFRMEFGIKLMEVYHGLPKAFEMMLAQMQSVGKLDPDSFTPVSEEELKKSLADIAGTPLAKVIALGEMAAWGMETTQFPFLKLPHPSGLNHKLNDKEFLQKQLEQARAWLYNLPER